MGKNIRTIIFIVIGVISIGLSIRCFSFKEMNYERASLYGGDAFTGIQNAGAQTSENVKDLAKIVQFGFGAVLLVAGLVFLGVGLTTPVIKRVEGNTQGEPLIGNVPEQTVNEESSTEVNNIENVKE